MTLDIQAELTIERLETPDRAPQDSPRTLSTVKISTSSDGTLQVTSLGDPPPVTVREARLLLARAREFVKATGQTLSITREARPLLAIRRLDSGSTKTKIHWWSFIRTFLASR